MTGEQLRRARIFSRLTEAKHSLEALAELLQLPDDRQYMADLAHQVREFRSELQARLQRQDTGG